MSNEPLFDCRCDHCAEGFHGDCLGGSQRAFGLPVCGCDCLDARSARRPKAADPPMTVEQMKEWLDRHAE